MRRAEQGPPRRQRSQRREVGDHGHRQLPMRSWGLLLLGWARPEGWGEFEAPGLGGNQEPGMGLAGQQWLLHICSLPRRQPGLFKSANLIVASFLRKILLCFHSSQVRNETAG